MVARTHSLSAAAGPRISEAPGVTSAVVVPPVFGSADRPVLELTTSWVGVGISALTGVARVAIAVTLMSGAMRRMRAALALLIDT